MAPVRVRLFLFLPAAASGATCLDLRSAFQTAICTPARPTGRRRRPVAVTRARVPRRRRDASVSSAVATPGKTGGGARIARRVCVR